MRNMTKRYGKSQEELQRCFLREWRKHRGLTQEQLADAIDSTKQTVSRMESGSLPYNQPFLEACADALNCRPANFLLAPPAESDDTKLRIVQALDGKTEGQLRKILQLIEIVEA